MIRSLLVQYRCILKFVIDQPSDIEEVHDWVSHFPDVTRGLVWLMPQARTQEQLSEKSSWLMALAAEHGFNFSSRLQIEQFGNLRGT